MKTTCTITAMCSLLTCTFFIFLIYLFHIAIIISAQFEFIKHDISSILERTSIIFIYDL